MGLRQGIKYYLIAFLVFLSIPNILYPPDLALPAAEITGGPRNKLMYYKNNTKNFNLVFVGDSRTYCGMDTAAIDENLGVKSINLSSWAHWFATQYPQLKELIPLIPKGTTVVWSIGHQNFHDILDNVNLKYPIPLSLLPDYLSAGFAWAEIKNNVIKTAAKTTLLGYIPGIAIYSQAGLIKATFERWANTSYSNQAVVEPHELKETYTISHKQVNEEKAAAYAELYNAKPDTMYVQFKREAGLITSLEVIKRFGSYVRVEIDQDFFRKKQLELKSNENTRVDPLKLPEKKYWLL
ncbi:MAG: hypothetical protein KDD56_07025, partial [Bdellovibrionales bacterium]|nr:hypothetical protein [Bdellovibrionales bacterium]